MTYLDLSENPIGYIGAKYLSQILHKNTVRLKQLDLLNDEIGDVGVKYLSQALQNNSVKRNRFEINFVVDFSSICRLSYSST